MKGQNMTIKLTDPYLKAQMKAGLYHLRRFKQCLPEGSQAFISGGFLRDLHHGFGCRDVDIFYWIPEDKVTTYYDPPMEKFVLSHLASFRRIKCIAEGDGGYDYDEHQGIQDIYEYTVNKGVLKYRGVQLIRLKCDPRYIIEDFPINMSRIYMGIDGVIHTTKEYDEGFKTKTIFECHGKQWNYLYLAKILGRYSDYAFVPYNWKRNKDMAMIEQLLNDLPDAKEKLFSDLANK